MFVCICVVAKTLTIRLCYGGHNDKWATEINLKVSHCELGKQFYNELLEIKTIYSGDSPGFDEAVSYYSGYEKENKGNKVYDSACGYP